MLAEKASLPIALRKICPQMEALAVAASRLMQVVRGVFVRLRMHSAVGLIFAGRHVVIRRASQLSFGRNVILEDYVDIDGMSLEGVRFGR